MRGEVWLQAQSALLRRGMAENSDQIAARSVTVRVRPSKRSRAGWVCDHVRGVSLTVITPIENWPTTSMGASRTKRDNLVPLLNRPMIP
jgi:hypothetical protein